MQLWALFSLCLFSEALKKQSNSWPAGVSIYGILETSDLETSGQGAMLQVFRSWSGISDLGVQLAHGELQTRARDEESQSKKQGEKEDQYQT